MITGEPKPVWKHAGDAVIGGTVSSGSGGGGLLLMRATKVWSETVLSQIVRLVQQAQMTKAPVQAFADRVSAVFVPIVVVLSVITWFTWWVILYDFRVLTESNKECTCRSPAPHDPHRFLCGVAGAFPDSWLPMGHTPFLFALLFGIAVIVISCPCALGLATPTAVMVGTGVAATLGILIKGEEDAFLSDESCHCGAIVISMIQVEMPLSAHQRLML